MTTDDKDLGNYVSNLRSLTRDTLRNIHANYEEFGTVFSPLAYALSLTVLLVASKGPTRKEIRRTLSITQYNEKNFIEDLIKTKERIEKKEIGKGNVKVTIDTALFYDLVKYSSYPVSKSFGEKIAKLKLCRIIHTDFSKNTVITYNGIQFKLKGNFSELREYHFEHKAPTFFVASAVKLGISSNKTQFFQWKNKFTSIEGHDYVFHHDKLSVLTRPMLATGSFKYNKYELVAGTVDVVQMPFKTINDWKAYFYLFLPSKISLKLMLQLIDPVGMAIDVNKKSERGLSVYMPNFRLNSELDARRMTPEMMNIYKEGEADFSEAFAKGQFLESMIHTSELLANENGLQSSTDNSASASKRSKVERLKQMNPTIRVDRPFAFLVLLEGHKVHLPIYAGTFF